MNIIDKIIFILLKFNNIKTLIMLNYYKDILINNIKYNLLNSISNHLAKITKERLVSNYLIFDFEPYKLVNTVEDSLYNLNKLFGNRIFEGSRGFYRFGDIIRDSKVNIHNGMLISIQLPFHSVNYTDYFDFIPSDVVGVILGELDYRSIANLPFKINENIYEYITRLKFPWLTKYLVKLLNDITPEDKKVYNWKKTYIELIRSKPNELLLERMSRSDLKWVSKYLYNVFSVLFIMKQYPGIYENFKGKLSVEDFKELYEEAENIHDEHPFYEYSQTGILPSNYVFKFSDIVFSGYYTRLISQMIKEGLNFESIEDYYKFIMLAYSHMIIIHNYEKEKYDPKFIEFLNDIQYPISEIDPIIEYINSHRGKKEYTNMLPLLETYRNSK